jgi:hypothetical protein
VTLRWSSGISAAAGALFGVLCTLGATQLLAKPAPVELVQQARSQGETRDARRLDKLSARVARLERTPASESSSSRKDALPAQAATEPVADEAQHDPRPLPERLSADYAAEPVDVAWARGAAATFDQDLRAMAKSTGSFEVRSLECRNHTCRAELRFQDAAQADAALDPLVHEEYRLDCPRTVLGPEPESEHAPHGSTVRKVYFHCADQRGSGPEAATAEQ